MLSSTSGAQPMIGAPVACRSDRLAGEWRVLAVEFRGRGQSQHDPNPANYVPHTYAADILKLLDQVAYACGSRYAGKYVATLSVDQVMFRQAINVGELVTFLASVNYTGTSSMEIGIKVVAEDIRKQSVRHANSCFFTMVAVDEDGRTTPVPPLQPSTPDEIRRCAAARLRRQLREEMERRHAELGGRTAETA